MKFKLNSLSYVKELISLCATSLLGISSSKAKTKLFCCALRHEDIAMLKVNSLGFKTNSLREERRRRAWAQELLDSMAFNDALAWKAFTSIHAAWHSLHIH